jgi:hypothetical protein
VGETPYGDGHRLVVRRTRFLGPEAELFPQWRHHAFITDRGASAVDLDADHRCHAVVELATPFPQLARLRPEHGLAS